MVPFTTEGLNRLVFNYALLLPNKGAKLRLRGIKHYSPEP